jgi:hypothetical protein
MLFILHEFKTMFPTLMYAQRMIVTDFIISWWFTVYTVTMCFESVNLTASSKSPYTVIPQFCTEFEVKVWLQHFTFCLTLQFRLATVHISCSLPCYRKLKVILRISTIGFKNTTSIVNREVSLFNNSKLVLLCSYNKNLCKIWWWNAAT